MSDAFDTTIHGIPADLYEASAWFADCFNSLDEVQDCLVHAANIREAAWQGAASDAYYAVSGGLSTLILGIQARLREGSDILQTYGDQLCRAQRDMAEILDEAKVGGLVTNGPFIQHPFLTVDPAQYADPSFAGKVELAERRASLYEHLESEAENAANELETWVAKYVIPFENKIMAIDLNGLLSDLAQNLGIAAVEVSGGTLIANAESLSSEAASLANRADSAAELSPLKDIGFPSRKAQSLSRAAGAHLASSQLSHVLGKGLGGLSSLGDVIVTAKNIWTSDNSSAEVVEAGCGSLATAATAFLGSGPGLAIGVGVASAIGGEHLYRGITPLETQEEFDDVIERVRDTIDDTVDGIIHDY